MTARGNNINRRRDRRGFTLVELMVVIAIIAILAGLLTTAGFAFVANAKASATRTTITKVDEAILERVSAINRWHERPATRLELDWENRRWLARWENEYGVNEITFPDVVVRESLMMKLSRKEAMKATFPITQSELRECYWFWGQFDGKDGNPGISNNAELTAMLAFLNDVDEDPSNNTTASGKYPGKLSTLGVDNRDHDGDGDLEQLLPGEIFLYCLKNAPVFGGLPMVTDDFRDSELIDQDEDGIPELADAWGNPLRFYRWPTRLVNNGEPFNANPNPPVNDGTANDIESANWADNEPRTILMPSAPSTLKQDSADPTGQLAYSGRTLFFHDPYTWSAPLVVSAGPDGQWGLEEPEVSLPITVGGNTFHRFGLARPLSSAISTPVPVKPMGSYTPPSPTSKPFNEYLYDNLTNHNSDGGL